MTISILISASVGGIWSSLYDGLIMVRFLFSLTGLFGDEMQIIIRAIMASIRVISEIFVLLAIFMFIFSVIGKSLEIREGKRKEKKSFKDGNYIFFPNFFFRSKIILRFVPYGLLPLRNGKDSLSQNLM